jgi:hypothetical protein
LTFCEPLLIYLNDRTYSVSAATSQTPWSQRHVRLGGNLGSAGTRNRREAVVQNSMHCVCCRSKCLGGLASSADRDFRYPTPAAPERVAPASASRTGPIHAMVHQERRWQQRRFCFAWRGLYGRLTHAKAAKAVPSTARAPLRCVCMEGSLPCRGHRAQIRRACQCVGTTIPDGL